MQLQSFFSVIIATAPWHLLADEECAMIQVKKERKDDNHTAMWDDVVGDLKQEALACAEGMACGLIDGATKTKIKNDFATAAANYGCMTEASKMGENASKGWALASQHKRLALASPCAKKRMTKSQKLCSSAYIKRQQALCEGLGPVGSMKVEMCQIKGQRSWPVKAKKLCGDKLSMSGALKACGYTNTTLLDDATKKATGLTQMACDMLGGMLFERIVKKGAKDKAEEEEQEELKAETGDEINEETEEAAEERNHEITKEEVIEKTEEEEKKLDDEAKEEESESDEEDPVEGEE